MLNYQDELYVLQVSNSRYGTHDTDEERARKMTKKNQHIPAYLAGIHRASQSGWTFQQDLFDPHGPPIVSRPASVVPKGLPMPRYHRYTVGVKMPLQGSPEYTGFQGDLRRGQLIPNLSRKSGTIDMDISHPTVSRYAFVRVVHW